MTSDGRTKHYDSIGSRVLDALTAEQLESYRNMYREHRFVFVLQEPDEAGVERWMLAEEMGCCRDEPLPAGSPLGFRLRRWLYLVRPQIVIMNGGGSGGQEIPIGRDLTTLRSRTSAHTHLPNPLPPGEDVVVATIDKEGRDSPESVVHRRAYAITCRACEP